MNAVQESSTIVAQALRSRAVKPSLPHALLVYLDQYQQLAIRSDQNRSSAVDGLAFPLLGLFGEVGTLLSALKKKQRDGDSYVHYSEAVVEEFGDVLWYLSNIASRLSLRLSDIAEAIADELPDLDSLQSGPIADPESALFEVALISLGGKAGQLLSAFSAGQLHESPRWLNNELREVFAAVTEAAVLAGVSIQAAAELNVAKINSRWPAQAEYVRRFDADLPTAEQLPDTIEMHVVETSVADRNYVIQLCNGVQIGSPLTDNKITEDDYRFHDVFHLSYAAFLGWSPCLRALLQRKRKSRPELDESEDGARAILIEEGVSTFVFNHALRLNFFADIESLDYALLKAIREFVRGYEVERCALWQWENAVLQGFDVFRKLRAERRGIVTANLAEHTLRFVPGIHDC
jgi:NTP pyrophosphatase (non-canonical NTP hydrolase)